MKGAFFCLLRHFCVFVAAFTRLLFALKPATGEIFRSREQLVGDTSSGVSQNDSASSGNPDSSAELPPNGILVSPKNTDDAGRDVPQAKLQHADLLVTRVWNTVFQEVFCAFPQVYHPISADTVKNRTLFPRFPRIRLWNRPQMSP